MNFQMPKTTLLVAAAMACVCTAARATEFRSADTHNADDYPTVAAVKYMSELLEKKSGGKHKIKVFNKGALGTEKETVDQVKIGALDFTRVNVGPMNAVCPLTQVPTMPFLFSSIDHMRRSLDGPIGDEISAIVRRKTGIEFVAYGEVGFRHLLSKRQVTTLDQLKGMKIRVPEIKVWVDFWRRLGANPTPLPYAEQYSALSSGVIDALEADYFSIRGFKWHEQAKFINLSYHWFLPKAIRVNAKWLDALPADLQAVVRNTAKEAFTEQRRNNRAKTDDALRDLEKVGVVVHRSSPEESAKWFAATRPLFEEFSAKSAETKAMVGRILALR